MVICFITPKDLSGHSYPCTLSMFLNFLFVQFSCKAISYYVCSYHNNKLLQCHMFMQQSFVYTVLCVSCHIILRVGGD